MTVSELERKFEVHLTEMKKCERAECYWALLHLAVVVPDICGSLETPDAKVGARYVRWCKENLPKGDKVRPGDRYQLRNSLLHEGSSRSAPNKVTGSADPPEEQKTQYATFSFVDPGAAPIEVHHLDRLEKDGTKNLAVDIKKLADDTVKAMRAWFGRVATGAKGTDQVAANVEKIIQVKPKESMITVGSVTMTVLYPNRSSTG